MGYVIRSRSESTESARFWARLFFVVGAIVVIWIVAPSTAQADGPTDTVADTTSTVEPTETVAETTSTVEPTETVAETTSSASESSSSTVSDATESTPAAAQTAADASATVQGASQTASDAADGVTGAVSDAAGDPVAKVTASAEEASRTATETINGATGAATRAADSATQTIRDAADTGVSMVADAGDAVVRTSGAAAADLSNAVRVATSEPMPTAPSSVPQLDGSDPVPVVEPDQDAPRSLSDLPPLVDRERSSLVTNASSTGVASAAAGTTSSQDDSASDTVPNRAATSRDALPATGTSASETLRAGSSLQDFAAVLVAIMIALGFARWSRRDAEKRYAPVFLSLAGNPG